MINVLATTENANPSVLQISIYVLIGVGILLCIGALVWTKLIRPNQFAYSYKNHDFDKKYKSWIQKLNSQSKVIAYQDLMLDFGDQKPILLERMFISVQNVYLVANPLSKKVLSVNHTVPPRRRQSPKAGGELPMEVRVNMDSPEENVA